MHSDHGPDFLISVSLWLSRPRSPLPISRLFVLFLFCDKTIVSLSYSPEPRDSTVAAPLKTRTPLSPPASMGSQ